ncbi:ABC transporter permease [Halobacteriales archaeon Cl-PHB]
MPSTDLDDAKFTDVDWGTESRAIPRPRYRTVGFVLTLAVLFALLAYDYFVAPRKLFAPLNWDVSRMGWLTLASLVLFARYAILPLVLDRRRAARYVRQFLSRPAGVASLLLLVFFGLVALVGPELFYRSYPRLADRLQPPAFAAVKFDDLPIVYECAGRAAEGTCHGTWQYPLGTTRIGEDIVLLLARGTRIALILGFSAAMIMGLVATAVGTTAGYVGGWVDDLLMGYVDVQQTVPAIIVYVILVTMFLGEIAGVTQGGLFALALVFGLLDWGGIARIVRSEVIGRRSKGYVRAAKAAGASDVHVIRRHIIPNSTATIVTALTKRIPLLILAQTALAYLALNRAGSKSLGRILRIGLEGRHMSWHRKWWVTTFAVVLLVGMVVAFSVFGDEVRDVIDPQTEVE